MLDEIELTATLTSSLHQRAGRAFGHSLRAQRSCLCEALLHQHAELCVTRVLHDNDRTEELIRRRVEAVVHSDAVDRREHSWIAVHGADVGPFRD